MIIAEQQAFLVRQAGLQVIQWAKRYAKIIVIWDGRNIIQNSAVTHDWYIHSAITHTVLYFLIEGFFNVSWVPNQKPDPEAERDSV